jgi:acetyl esterase/lipase
MLMLSYFLGDLAVQMLRALGVLRSLVVHQNLCSSATSADVTIPTLYEIVHMRHHFNLFLLFSAMTLHSAHCIADEPTYVQHENIVYAEPHGIGLLMDVFTPRGDANGLAIIDVMSGAWHSDRGKINDHKRARTFDILCGKGYTVFAIRPGSVTKFSAKEMVDNLNQGILWAKNHADEYKVDPDRMGMMGASAGGHLACLATVTARSQSDAGGADEPNTRVKAVAVFFPPTDFLDFGGKPADVNGESRIGKLVRALAFPNGIEDLSEEQRSQALKQISPARLVTKHLPPFLLIHGDADPDVPLQQSERMVAALRKAGVPAQLIIKPGGAHPWPTIHEEVAILADWFDKQLVEE